MFKFLLLTAALFVGAAVGFVPQASPVNRNTALNIFGGGAAKSSKLATPTFNKETQKWEKAASDDGKYPYDAVGALLRHGPFPFVSRVLSPDDYEQQVLKYMAVAKVDRAEATGNMDAKLNNAADWAYQKMEEKRGRPKVDFTYLDKKKAALTATWAIFIIPTVYYVIEKTFSQVMSH